MGRDVPPALELDQARYTYEGGRKRASRTIGPVSCRVHAGEWVALIGPNGSGKSTILHLMSGATSPAEGAIRWFGGVADSAARRRIGVVFQSAALDPLLTVREALTTAARVQQMAKADARERIDELASELEFTDRLDDRVGTLSGGLTRRVDLARATLHRPELVVLDEATAGLDEDSRLAFNRMLDRLRSRGVAIVASTHLIEEVRRADRVLLLQEGRVAVDTTVDELPRLLGGAKLRVEHANGDLTATLDAYGLRPGPDGATIDMSSLTPEQTGRLVSDLTARGAHITAGPPSLHDLFRHTAPAHAGTEDAR